MNPVFIGAAIAGGLLLLKKKQDSQKGNTGGGVTKPPPVASQAKDKTDAEHLRDDTLAIVGGSLGTITGGLAFIGGGSVTGGLSTVAGGIGAAFASAGLAVVPIAVIAILVAAGIMGAHTAQAKSMSRLWLNYLPNARIMCGYEAARIEQFAIKNNIVVQKTRTVTDPRLEAKFSADGQQYVYIGERAEWSKTDSAPNAVSYIEVCKALRAVAIVYALECGKHANALLRNWGPKIGSGGHTQLAANDFWLYRMYDNLPGYEGENLGGLASIPLANGDTKVTRINHSQTNPPASQLMGFNSEPSSRDLVAALIPEAKLCAFKNVLQTIQFDNAIYLPFDPKRYAKDVYQRMELDPQWFVLQGSVIVLPFGAWGFRDDAGRPVHLNVDVQNVKDNGPLANWYATAA